MKTKSEVLTSNLAKIGRPKTIKGRSVHVYLDEKAIEIARVIGGGNVSDGIRVAVFAYGAKKVLEKAEQVLDKFNKARKLQSNLIK